MPDESNLTGKNTSRIRDKLLPVMCVEDDSTGVVETKIEIRQLEDSPKIGPLAQITQKRCRETEQQFLDCLSAKCKCLRTSSNDGLKIARKEEEMVKPLEHVIKIVSEAKSGSRFKHKNTTDRAEDWYGRGNVIGTLVTAYHDIPDIPVAPCLDLEQICKDSKTKVRMKHIKEFTSAEKTSSKMPRQEEMSVAADEGKQFYFDSYF